MKSGTTNNNSNDASNIDLDSTSQLSEKQIKQFHQNGFLVIPSQTSEKTLKQWQDHAKYMLNNAQPPWELESDLGYPGAPSHESKEGIHTVRRLLRVYERDSVWREWAHSPVIITPIKQLLNTEQICLSQNHHNCLMTKAPRFSSDTGWHQDIRYWSFHDGELITAWLALGKETSEMGSIHVIPGSQKETLRAEQFDQALFFTEQHPDNKRLIAKEQAIELNAGDVLLFDSRLLHRASRNRTEKTKLSLVFTYRRSTNQPLSGSRSSLLDDICL